MISAVCPGCSRMSTQAKAPHAGSIPRHPTGVLTTALPAANASCSLIAVPVPSKIGTTTSLLRAVELFEVVQETEFDDKGVFKVEVLTDPTGHRQSDLVATEVGHIDVPVKPMNSEGIEMILAADEYQVIL